MKFHYTPCNKAPKTIVHKHRDDDVFLYNCRGALPVFFNAELLQLSNLDNEDLFAIRDCYREVDFKKNEGATIYCLKNIPWKLKPGESDFEALNAKNSSWLDTYYLETNGTYVLQECAIPEGVQQEMLATFSDETLSEYARYRASVALDKLKINSGVPIFHCTVYNDTKHYYFYGKRHEHVPGIKLMEIARQAFYANFYKFNKHTRESVNLSILNFNCEFANYLQSNYPVFIAVETLSCTLEGASREKHHLRATFTQRGQVACTIEMTGSVVAVKLFKKLRDVKPPTKDAFATICNETKVNVLLRADCGELVEGVMVSISADTLIIQTPDSGKLMKTLGSYKVHLFTQHFGIITGDGISNPQDPRGKEGTAAIRITDWSKNSATKFREFLKMDCYLIEPSYATIE